MAKDFRLGFRISSINICLVFDACDLVLNNAPFLILECKCFKPLNRLLFCNLRAFPVFNRLHPFCFFYKHIMGERYRRMRDPERVELVFNF
jgi:hypothetical protein